MRTNKRKGFSLIEIVIIVSILVVIAAVLTPALLQYTENSRAQKDVSAMDEVTAAVQFALADQNCFDEMLRYSCTNNYLTYSDSSGIYGQQEIDEEFWAPDGYGRATTITFNPEVDANGKVYYDFAKAYVNDMTYSNGSVAPERIMEGQIIDENQCYLKDVVGADGAKNGYLYNALRQAIGNTLSNQSATYRNSSFTVFIRFTQKDGATVADVYGQFNGTNLHDGAMASNGTHTEEYDEESGEAKPNVNGGQQEANFSSTDLSGSGTYCPGMITEKEEHDTIQEGGNYVGNNGHYEYIEHEYEWGEIWLEEVWVPGSNAGEDFNEGDEMPEPSIGDTYTYGDYEYRYGMWCYVMEVWYLDEEEWIEYTKIDDVWLIRGTSSFPGIYGSVEYVPHCFDDYATFEPGWSVRVIDKTKSSYGPILTEIAGKPVNGLAYTYANCKNITDISWVTFPESTQNIGYIFSGCNNLTSIPKSFKIPSFVRAVPGVFENCTKITAIPKTFSIPATNQDMAYVFKNTGITEIPSTFKIPNKTTNISYLFANTKITSIPETLTIPDSVTNVSGLFSGCSKLSSLPQSFNLGQKVTDVSNMFNSTTSLKTLPESFTLPDSVTKVSHLFNSSGLISLPEHFGLPSKLSDMSYMFYSSKIVNLPSAFTIPSTVKNMDYAFAASSIATYPSGFKIPSGCTSARSLFEDSGLQTLPDGFKIPKATNVYNAFYSCKSLKYLPNGFKIEEGNTTNGDCLFASSGIITLPDGFNFPTSMTDYGDMFTGCSSLTHLPKGFTIQSGVTDARKMFYNCSSLKSLPDSFSIPSSVRFAYYMFYNCTSLGSLKNVTNFNQSNKIGDMNGMFYGCSSLSALPQNFTIPKDVYNVGEMFYGCSQLSDVITVNINNDDATRYWLNYGNSYYYGNAFYGTTKPIYLAGSASNELKEKMRAGRSNIYIGSDYIPLDITIVNNAPDTIEIVQPGLLMEGCTIEVKLVDSLAGSKTLVSFDVNGVTYTGNQYTLTETGTLTFSNPVLLDQKIIESEHDYKTKSSHSLKLVGSAYFEGAKSLDVKITHQFYGNGSLELRVDGTKIATYSGSWSSSSSYKYTKGLRIAGDSVDVYYSEYGTNSSSKWYGYKIEVTPIYDSSDVEFYIDLPDCAVLTATTHPIKNTTSVTLMSTKVSVIESFQVNGNTISGKTYTFKSSDGNSAVISNIKQYEINYVNNIPEYADFWSKSSQPNGYYDVYTNNSQYINTITINGEVHNVGGTSYAWSGYTPKTSGTISLDAIELFEAEIVNMCADTVDAIHATYDSNYLYVGQTISLVPKDSSKCVDSFKLNGELINGGEFAVPSSGGTLTITDVIIRDYIKGEAYEKFYYLEDWGGYGEIYISPSLPLPCDVKVELFGHFDYMSIYCGLINDGWMDEIPLDVSADGNWYSIRPMGEYNYLFFDGYGSASDYDPDNLPYVKLTVIPYE